MSFYRTVCLTINYKLYFKISNIRNDNYRTKIFKRLIYEAVVALGGGARNPLISAYERVLKQKSGYLIHYLHNAGKYAVGVQISSPPGKYLSVSSMVLSVETPRTPYHIWFNFWWLNYSRYFRLRDDTSYFLNVCIPRVFVSFSHFVRHICGQQSAKMGRRFRNSEKVEVYVSIFCFIFFYRSVLHFYPAKTNNKFPGPLNVDISGFFEKNNYAFWFCERLW